MDVHAPLQEGRGQAVHRRAVALDGSLEGQALAHAHDGDAVAAHVSAHEHGIPGLDAMGTDVDATGHDTDARSVDEHPVALAPVHHLGITGDDGHTALGRRRPHGLHHLAQLLDRIALLEHHAHAQPLRHGPAHGQVVHRTVDRQLADVAPGEEAGLHHVGVRGEGHAHPAQVQQGRVVPRVQGRVVEGGEHHLFQQLPHDPPPAPVGELDGVVAHGQGTVEFEIHGSAWEGRLFLVAPVAVVGRAGPFVAHHGRTERVVRGTAGAEGRALVGLDDALQHEAALALGGLGAADPLHLEAQLGVEGGVLRAQAPPALRDHADPAPGPVPHLEHGLDELLGRAVALGAHHPFVLVLDLVAARLELPDQHVDGLEQVHGLEARHHDGHLVLLGQGHVLRRAHDAAHVARGDEAVHPPLGRGQHRFQGRGHQDVGDQDGVVLQPPSPGLEDRHGVGRCRGLEAHREEHHLPAGVLLGDLQAVQGRVDDPHVPTPALHAEEVRGRARDPQHVAEGAEDHLRTLGDGHGLVDELDGRDADRAAGTMDEVDLRGQQLIEAEADDAVGLAPADLHEAPGAGHLAADGLHEAPRGSPVPVLVKELHPASPARTTPGPRTSLKHPARAR